LNDNYRLKKSKNRDNQGIETDSLKEEVASKNQSKESRESVKDENEKNNEMKDIEVNPYPRPNANQEKKENKNDKESEY